MPKRQPTPSNDHGLTHAQEMFRRKAERAARVPHGNHRTKTELQIINGAVIPTPRHTMFNGVRISRSGLPRSRAYRYQGKR